MTIVLMRAVINYILLLFGMVCVALFLEGAAVIRSDIPRWSEDIWDNLALLHIFIIPTAICAAWRPSLVGWFAVWLLGFAVSVWWTLELGPGQPDEAPWRSLGPLQGPYLDMLPLLGGTALAMLVTRGLGRLALYP